MMALAACGKAIMSPTMLKIMCRGSNRPQSWVCLLDTEDDFGDDEAFASPFLFFLPLEILEAEVMPRGREETPDFNDFTNSFP